MSKFLNFDIQLFLSQKIVFIIENSADPDEMPHYAAFHLSLQCMSRYLFTGIQNEMRYKSVRFDRVSFLQ